MDEIINTFQNDFNLFKNKYINNSKEPFQFLACVISYYDYINYNIEIRIPILFDASCSGIQHLSALTTDTKIAQLVNLLNNDSPSDFYQYCLDEIVKIINSIPDNGFNKGFKDKILKLNIDRKWLKHSIMTIPYNVTNIGISDKLTKYFESFYLDKNELIKLESGKVDLNQIKKDKQNILPYKKDTIKKDKLINKDQVKNTNREENKGTYIYIPFKEILFNENDEANNNLYFTSKELLYFSSLVKNTVLNIIPPFTNLKNYFDNMIEIMKKLDLPVYWQTPAGMTVSMSNRIMLSKQIKTKLIKKAKPISILIPTDQIDYKNIKTGLMPNFIHSLDASNIHILIKNIFKLNKQNINLFTIHDCFASDYKEIALIELLVKHSFVELYFRKNYLEHIHNSFYLQIKSETEIFNETKIIDGKEIKEEYILCNSDKLKTKKLYIPVLPDYK